MDMYHCYCPWYKSVKAGPDSPSSQVRFLPEKSPKLVLAITFSYGHQIA